MLHWHAMVCVAEDLGRLVHERRRLGHGRVETTHVVVHDDGVLFFLRLGSAGCGQESEWFFCVFFLSFTSSSSCWRISVRYSSCCREANIQFSWTKAKDGRLVVLVVVLVWGRERRGVCVLSKVVLSERYGNDSKLQVSASAKCKQQESSDFRYPWAALACLGRRRPQVQIGAGSGTGYGGDLVCCRFDNDGMQCPERLAQLGKPPDARHHRRGHR